MNIVDMIKGVQRSLRVKVDGHAGPETWRAIYAAIVQYGPSPVPVDIDRVDDRSERQIETLLPDVRPYARALVQRATALGTDLRVIGGTRSIEEQNALYAKGRTARGPKVTNARGGYSTHNFGIAFDVGVFVANRYQAESPKYTAIGAVGIDLGLNWGGNWARLVD